MGATFLDERLPRGADKGGSVLGGGVSVINAGMTRWVVVGGGVVTTRRVGGGGGIGKAVTTRGDCFGLGFSFGAGETFGAFAKRARRYA